LTYIFFIPLLWWFLIRFESATTKWHWALLITAYLLWFAFTHVYYLAIGGFMVMLYTLCRSFIFSNKQKKSWKDTFTLFFAGLFPFLFIYALVYLVDDVHDRPVDPWGFFAYATTVKGLLTSPYSSFSGVYNLIKTYNAPGMESETYLGICGIVGILNATIMILVHRNKARGKSVGRKREFTFPGFVLASFMLLIFSMAIPFKWNLEWLLDIFSPLKQFRAPGRLAWPFYFSITILSAIYFYKLHRILRIKELTTLGASIIVLVVCIWTAESYSYLKATILPLKKNQTATALFGENGNYNELLKNAGFSKKQFQAIMSIPYYQHGSEKLYIYGNNGSLYEAEKASLNLKMPIVNGYVTRTSIDRSLKLIQLISSSMIHKEAVKDFPDQRPLLLIVSKEPGLVYRQGETDLIARATLIKEGDNFDVYSLPLSAFDDTIPRVKNFIADHKDSFSDLNGYYTDGRKDVIIQHFDETQADHTLWSKGALYCKNGFVDLYNDTIPFATDSTEYEFSIWLYTNKKHNSYPWVNYWQTDSTGNMIEQKGAEGKVSVEVYENWVRLSLNFVLQNKKNKVLFRLDGNKDQVIDEMLVKPINTHVYIPPENGKFYFDGYAIE
jgi:hypothetical protein